MRRVGLLLVGLLVAAAAEARQPAPLPRWDVNVSAAAFEAQPEETDARYDDGWYFEGRYAVGLGYYWTEHIKTEFEFAHSGESSVWVQDFGRTPDGAVYPVGEQRFHRLQHYAGRAVWQFGTNNWVHPYLNGGFVFEADRRHTFSPLQFHYPVNPGGTPAPPVPVRGEIRTDPVTTWRAGVTAGGGARFYVSTTAYLSAGVQVTHAKPSTTVAFLAGIGVDF